ncbi:MAG: DUF4190 domain-containing protein [Microterricola sp.]
MSATIPVVPSAPAEPAPTAPAAEGTNSGQPFAAPAPAAEPVSAAEKQWMSISSLVLGVVSIVAGWTFFLPVAGLVFGILALKREPSSRTMAIWGVVLNGALLAGSVLIGLGALLFGLVMLPFAFLPFGSF